MKLMNQVKFQFIVVAALFSLFIASCKVKDGKQNNDERAVQTSPFTYINDSTWIERIYNSDGVNIDLVNSAYKYSLKIAEGENINTINFEAEGIPSKTPEFKWANESFVCIVTWWSASFSRYVFIDLNNTANFIYLDKDIELTDPGSNNIVYIDSIQDNSMVLKVENLLSRNHVEFSMPIDLPNSIYPHYDEMHFTDDSVIVTASGHRYGCPLVL